MYYVPSTKVKRVSLLGVSVCTSFGKFTIWTHVCLVFKSLPTPSRKSGLKQKACHSLYSPGLGFGCGRGGGETTTLTHFLVQFDWRQHLSPRLQISSDRQPFTAGHAGIGFNTGHSPGLLPKVNSKQISKNLWMQRISFRDSRIAYPQLIIISNVWHSSPKRIKIKIK